MSPLIIYFFEKCTQGHSYCSPPPRILIFEPRGYYPNQTQNFPLKVIYCQTLRPLFFVLENACMIKSQFPHHSLSYVRSEWNKLPQDTTEDMQFFQPSPAYCNPVAYLLSDFFPTPPSRLLPLPFYSGLDTNMSS